MSRRALLAALLALGLALLPGRAAEAQSEELMERAEDLERTGRRRDPPGLSRSDPDPDPEPALPPPVDADVSEADILRWAARETARVEGRVITPRAPLPPEPYLGHGDETVRIAPPGEPEAELRILAELGGGLLAGAVGAGLGALLVWGMIEADAPADATAVTVGVAVALGGLGITSGVTLAGELREGRGNFGHAFLGQLLGALAALPLVVVALDGDLVGAAIAASAVLPLAGSLIGYEVGHAHGAPRATLPLGASPSAFVVPTPDGVRAGVGLAL